MRKAELLVCGVESAVAGRLEKWAQANGVWFRAVAEPRTLLNLLRQGSRGAILLRLGRDLYDELDTLQLAARGFPEVPVVALGDFAHPDLEGLVCDLGAAGALHAGRDTDQLLEWLPALFGPAG
jgi:hypothetical protein